MSDLVVTVPKKDWREWISEGDAAGDPWSGNEWGFYLGRKLEPIRLGERLYIVSHGRLRGYAPVTRVIPWLHSPQRERRGDNNSTDYPWLSGLALCMVAAHRRDSFS